MDKHLLVSSIISYLEYELADAIEAATNAHSAAVDNESVAETQYDTLAIEAGYLAEGQSKRVQEYQTAIAAFRKLPVKDFDQNTVISVGALVQLKQDSECHHWFFIAPFAGGFRTELFNQQFTVITPQSPMGTALIGKLEGDEISIRLGGSVLTDYIFSIC